MAANWPSSLQQRLSSRDFTMSVGDVVIRTRMDTGPMKIRRRFTKAVDIFTCSILLDRNEYNTFRTFYDVTLANGSLPFNYLHPLTNVVTEFVFMSPPDIRALGGNVFQISMKWMLKV